MSGNEMCLSKDIVVPDILIKPVPVTQLLKVIVSDPIDCWATPDVTLGLVDKYCKVSLGILMEYTQ